MCFSTAAREFRFPFRHQRRGSRVVSQLRREHEKVGVVLVLARDRGHLVENSEVSAREREAADVAARVLGG